MLVVDAGPAAAEMRAVNIGAQTAQETPATAEADKGPAERPDAVSAQVTARAQNTPIEDLSQRTEATQTFANPDGTWSLESFSTPVFTDPGDGKLVPVNTELKVKDKKVKPAASPVGLELSNGATPAPGAPADLVTITDDSTGKPASLTLRWEGALPQPSLKSGKATYKGAADRLVTKAPASPKADAGKTPGKPATPAAPSEPGQPSAKPAPAPAGTTPAPVPTTAPAPAETATAPTTAATPSVDAPASVEPEEKTESNSAGADVVVETTKTGFSHNVVLKEAPVEPLELRFPLGLTEGLTATIVETGAIEVRDAEGKMAFFGSKPLMWDSAVDKQSGLPTTTVPVETSLEKTGADTVLVLRPDQKFLTDPARQYPVTVDPTWSTPASAGTFVQSDNASPQHGSTELRLGTFDGGVTKARSYLLFPTSSLTGKQILSANVQVHNWWSWSCEARNTYAQRVTGAWNSTTLTWANQPTVTDAGQLFVSSAKGASSACPAGDVLIPATNIVADWAANPGHNYGIRLVTANESDSFGWRRYRSSAYATGDNAVEPHLKVTYNSYPNTPTYRGFGAGQAVDWTDPVTKAVTTYVKTVRPSVSALVTDPDGGSLRLGTDIFDGTTLVWDKVRSDYVASGARATSVPATTLPALVNGKTYTSKLWSGDGNVFSKTSLNSTFTVDTSAPGAPTVAASGVANNGWTDTKPANNRFTFSSTATDTVKFQYSKDGAAFVDLPATGTSPKTAFLDWTPDGGHELRVRAIDKATNVSADTTFKFGFGGAALTAPKNGASSTDTFKIIATAPAAGSGTVTPKIYWRAAGTANGTGFSTTNGSTDGWTLAETLPAIGANTAVKVDKAFDAAAAATALGKARVPALLDVQTCFTYTSPALTRCTWIEPAASQVSVLRLPHAFGNGYPETTAGPGKAALYTGELNLSETDVAVNDGATGLSISRVYSSLSGVAADSGAFGPGWRASFGGPQAGLGGYLVVDTTGTDGTIALIGDNQAAMVFRQPGGTKTAGKVGIYEPVNDDAVSSGLKLEVSGSGASARITLTQVDGTSTFYLPGKIDGPTRVWDTEKIVGPASTGTVSYSRDAAGRLVRILAPVEAGITCPANGMLTQGCRALDISYSTATSAGKISGQVDTISYTAWDISKGAATSQIMADYRYDAQGRLITVLNKLNDLKTDYTYGPNSSSEVPLLSSIRDAGSAPYKFTFGQGNGSSRADWLESVSRGAADGTSGDIQETRLVYGVKPAGDGVELPDLSLEAVKLWDQASLPVEGAAVFAADKPISTSKALSIASSDFRFSTLQFWDSQGHTVNAAAYGAGEWQIEATDYGPSSKPVRQFTTGATRQIRDLAKSTPSALTNGVFGNSNEFASITRYVTNAAGTFPTDTWGPAAPSGGEGRRTRAHTRTVYTPITDVNPATGKPRMLSLESIVSETDAAAATTDSNPAGDPSEPVLSHRRKGYDALGSKDKLDPTSGWVHGVPTSETILMGTGSADITTVTVLDERGRTVETRKPNSAGSDAGTTSTTYYSALPNTAVPQCGNKPAWAGLTCVVSPRGTGAPSEHTTQYDHLLNPTQVVESDGAATRTTDTSYLLDGRVDSVKTTTSGLANSTPTPQTKNLYDPNSGLQNATLSIDAAGAEISRISWDLDQWGRTTTYTNAGGEKTVTTYTPTSDVLSVTTPHGTTSYTYDGTDALGHEERRGLPVSMKVSNHGAAGTTGTYSAAYGASGTLITQKMPGGITQDHTYDQAGRVESLSYSGDVTTVQPDGTTTKTMGPWVTWSHIRNTQGQIVKETTPDGILTASAEPYQREYTYDGAQRLITVLDRTAAPGTDLNTDPGAGPVTGCVTRSYKFDPNGNRTAFTASKPAPNGSCSSEASTSHVWTYDSADRVATGANGAGQYAYDGLGRQTTVPAADAPATEVLAAGSSDIKIGYYDNDEARTITRDGKTTTFQIDPSGRRLTVSDGSATETNGYSDGSDNPSWVAKNENGTSALTRYQSGIGGNLGILIDDTSARLAVSNPHGDVVTTIELPSEGNATGLDSWSNFDEYGNNAGARPSTGIATYAWHGAAQRALDDSGLILMGARLYNPATGLFTSRDPVAGGNTTSYTYPQDPINKYDTSGEYFVLALVPVAILVAVLVVAFYYWWYWNLYPSYRWQWQWRTTWQWRWVWQEPAPVWTYIWFAHKKKQPARNSDRNGHGDNIGSNAGGRSAKSDKHGNAQSHGGRNKLNNPNKRANGGR